ncbi:MAG: hypothetical protein IKY44_02640 [Clostridia bacterium]|nr:hypothetical protein [Clostridia bacterium]
MIDIHCHILPYIDDGAKNMDEAIKLCEIARDNGIDKIIVTPHVACLDDIDGFLGERDVLIDELRSALKYYNIDVELYPGAELYVNDDVFFSGDLTKLTLNGSKYILVEFDFYDLTPNKISSYLIEIMNFGLVPIVAHPERYEYMQRDYNFINFLSERGVLFQVNMNNVVGRGSHPEFVLARELVRKRVATFIASDAHSAEYRSNNLRDMIEGAPHGFDIDERFFLNDMPQIILGNGDIPYIKRGRAVASRRDR